jgi:hypothetical protein
MSKFTYMIAMLTATGAAGVAAASTTQTLNIAAPDPALTTPVGAPVIQFTPITLAGASAPQFYFIYDYGQATGTDNGSVYEAIDLLLPAKDVSSAATFITFGGADLVNPYYESSYSNSAVGMKSLMPGLPGPSETFTKPGAITGVYANPNIDTSGAEPVDLGDINDLSYKIYQSTGQYDYYSHVVFDSEGATYLGSVHVGQDGGLIDVTYGPVPEPDAWALLIAGSALAGGALRARRRKGLAIA